MSAKTKALEGVLERFQGRQASRFQAVLAAAGAGFAVYKLLRSGSSADDEGDGAGAAEAEQSG